MIALYSAAMELAVWLLLVPLELLRLAVGRSSLQVVAERIGRIRPSTVPAKRRLLIHAVSAGEMNVASALVHELATRGWSFVLSAGNEDAHTVALRIRGFHDAVERVVFWPWDRRAAVRRWLAATRCDAVVVIETEIWPALFLACRDLRIPLVIAGGRIDRRAFRWYRAFRFFFAGILDAADAILVTGAEEKERYLAIGAPAGRISIAGDLKADACLILHQSAARRPGDRKVVVAASTHEGEEQIVADAIRGLHADRIDLVLAPRHVHRAAALRRAIDATVLDRMGTLAGSIASADVVVIGGTFVDVGGHDPYEAARAGCAIVVGPFVDRIRETVEGMIAADAIRTATPDSLGSVLASLLSDAAERRRLSNNAREFAASRAGTAARCAGAIEALLASRAA